MAMLGVGNYLCEACKHFDSDGQDGNHPQCYRQMFSDKVRAVRVGESCPFGFELGVPSGYPVSMPRNVERAAEVRAMLRELGFKVE